MGETEPEFILLSNIPFNGQFLINIFGPTFKKIRDYGKGRSLVQQLPGGEPEPMANNTPVISIHDEALSNTSGFNTHEVRRKRPDIRQKGLFD